MEILLLWLHIVMFVLQFQTGFSFLKNITYKNPLCRPEQRQLLLQLKQQLSPIEGGPLLQFCPERLNNYYKTKLWNSSSDCCLWDGITCDQVGRVIGLDLSCGILTGNIDSNSSVFHLSHLQKLNLAYNAFGSPDISSEFGWLNSLTHLNLSVSGLGGQIPMEFYYLNNLVSLDMTGFILSAKINCDIKLLFGNMTKIKVLLLEYVNISSEIPMNMSSFLTHLDLSITGIYGNLPVSIFEETNLQVLRLSDNEGLQGSLPESLNQSNVHSFKELDLSTTSISGRLPESIGFMNKLNYIRLRDCKFWGPIPESIGNISDITEIHFSSNEFTGKVPSTISNLRQLTHLFLSGNHLEGQLPDAFTDLQKLTYLDLQSNNFVGQIPSSLTNMSQLVWLDISSNALTGPFPSRAGDGLQKLSDIKLSHNSIPGAIPSWLLSLPSLENLDLSFNRLTGQTGKFNCKSLYDLDLRNNQLNIELESFYNLINITKLRISYNTVTEHAREIVNVTLPCLSLLELSSCGIKEFPTMLRYLPRLYSLDLSTNNLTYAGYLPWQQLESLLYLDLHSNSLQGTFPLSICNMSQLFFLNLSNNKLRGRIPECVANMSLTVLDMRRNEFHGEIPTTIGSANKQLANLGLNGNYLEGSLPRSLANCTELEVLDLGNNMIHDTFPRWLEMLTRLEILILTSNRFHGSISPSVSNDSFSQLQIIDLSYNNFTGLLPERLFTRLEAMKNQDQATERHYLGMGGVEGYSYSVTLSMKGKKVELTKVLSIFTSIDLSSNNFHGRVPGSLANLSSLRLLNLSHNSLNESIPPSLGHLTNLEQLDLSSNQLVGDIPQTLTNLTFLGFLNLSDNHLTGPIPQTNQFPTFSNDSYIGNSGLCGAPLMKKCGDDKAPSPPVVFQEEEEDDSGFMMGFTWKAVVMGYGCGIVVGFILGNVMISIGKPKWLARFVKAEAANCLRRRKKRGRVVQGRR